ncbi:MAG: glycosyltransferase family 9 protein [Actinobacteria bacterium]|nr:glycosyltransferase family 9 protein [Actinomycetota bacterium]MBW3641765.1 glycosyltransferase family 9 protein [Actinomycetota bacterium]
MAPPTWQGAERVLAVRLDNIGDVLMLGPALRSLRAALPAAELTALVSPAGSQAAPLLPWIDDVIVHRAVWQDASGAMPLDPAAELELVDELRRRQFDAAFVFTSFSQSPWPPAYTCYLAGIPFRAGQVKDFGGSVLTSSVPAAPDAGHQVDRNLHLLEALGVAAVGRELEVVLPGPAVRSADVLLAGAGIDPERPFVVAAPGASCTARQYDPARFAALVSRLRADGLPVVVVGSQREGDVIGRVQAVATGSLVGRTTVSELAAVIARAALVVCNNSGPLHLADALRRPVVVLYSGTDHESQWWPRASPHRLLRRVTTCSPCFAFECPYDHECLDIGAEEVAARCLEVLEWPREEVSTAPCVPCGS